MLLEEVNHCLMSLPWRTQPPVLAENVRLQNELVAKCPFTGQVRGIVEMHRGSEYLGGVFIGLSRL